MCGMGLGKGTQQIESLNIAPKKNGDLDKKNESFIGT